MFRRALAPVIGATALTVAMLASPASGRPEPDDDHRHLRPRDVTPVAVVTMFDRVGGTQVGDPTTVVCGTDAGLGKRERVVVENPSAVGAASIGGYDVTIGSLTTSCTGEGTLTFELRVHGRDG